MNAPTTNTPRTDAKTIDLTRLYQSMPKRLQKEVSCHELKLICDAYNGDQPPVDNNYVDDGCEKFGPLQNLDTLEQVQRESKTPRTDAMPSNQPMLSAQSDPVELYHKLIAVTVDFGKALDACVEYRKQLTVSQAEVERLTQRMKEAEDLIKGLHDGWKKARVAHLETCKNAQLEIDKLHTENVCLQELIQEFYEWSRRDFPTEQEVREIMNRYHDLLNK